MVQTRQQRRMKQAVSHRRINTKFMRTLIKGSRILLERHVKTSPSNLRKLKKLAASKTYLQADRLVQRGGLLGMLPLVALIGCKGYSGSWCFNCCGDCRFND